MRKSFSPCGNWIVVEYNKGGGVLGMFWRVVGGYLMGESLEDMDVGAQEEQKERSR